MQRATTQWGALSVTVMLGSLEMELTVAVRKKLIGHLIRRTLAYPKGSLDKLA